MKFEYLREFITAARSSELQQAAAELGISLSSLSKHMKSIELEIGVPLFVRSRRTVLSQYGRVMLPYAQELVALQDDYRNDFRFPAAAAGEITVALAPIQLRERAGQVIEDFMLANPSVRVNIAEFGNSDLIAQVKSGKCDMAFIKSQQELTRDDELVYFPFSHSRLVAYLPPEHPLAGEESIGFQQLRNETFLLRSESSAIYKVCVSQCSRLGFTPKISCVSSFAVYDMVRRGEGITLYLSRPAFPEYDTPLAIVPISPAVTSYIDLVLRRNSLSPAAESFLRFVQERSFAHELRR